MKIDLPDFFMLPNEFSPLNSCETKLIEAFGHNEANFSQMGYISRGKIKVEFSTTNLGKSMATFFSEKYIKTLAIKVFIKNDKNETSNPYNVANTNEYEIAISPIAKTIDLFAPIDLCKSYNCLQKTFEIQFAQPSDHFSYIEAKSNSSIIKNIYPSSIVLGYNCIGWALGVETWINPSVKLPKAAFSNGTKLAISVANFIKDQIEYFSKESNSHLLKLDIMKNLKTISCLQPISSIKILNGAVAFYFKNGDMTHAARYVDKIGDQKIEAWTSKLGQSFLVWHELDDLNEGGYGEHLCYALPGETDISYVTVDGSIN